MAEEILKPLLATICEECHHEAVKDHTYCPQSCTIHLLPNQSTKCVMRGDMNHVYKVCIRIECAGEVIKCRDIPLVVKCAPEKVLFIQEIAGQEVPLDPLKVQFEHAALSKFYEIQHGSVPKPYGLNLKSRAVVMEDISSYVKLQDQLVKGRVVEHVSAIIGAFRFIGLVHKTTWIQSLPHDQGQQLVEEFNHGYWLGKPLEHNISSQAFDSSPMESPGMRLALPGFNILKEFLREKISLTVGEMECELKVYSLPDFFSESLASYINSSMKLLMAQFLFDRPYTATDPSNKCNPLLAREIGSVRKDPAVLSRVAQLRTEFLQQLDCLCHGDFACDNVFVKGNSFKVLDLEFASIGLCAYDLALLLETLMFLVLYHSFHGHWEAKELIHSVILNGIEAYEAQVGSKRMNNPDFIRQVTGLIGCEQIWRVLGAAEIDEFEGKAEPERLLLNMGKELLQTTNSDSISNILPVLDQYLHCLF